MRTKEETSKEKTQQATSSHASTVEVKDVEQSLQEILQESKDSVTHTLLVGFSTPQDLEVPIQAIASNAEETIEGGDKALYHLEPGTLCSSLNPKAQQVTLEALPSTLAHFKAIVQASEGPLAFITQKDKQESSTSLSKHALKEKLRNILAEQSQNAKEQRVYTSSNDLLQALKLPLTPQPEFERSLHLFQGLLEDLKAEGFLVEAEGVHFQLKLYNTLRFKEAHLEADSPMHALWKAHDEMKLKLPPLQSLKLTFMNGRQIDLRELSKHLPYTISELNQLLSDAFDAGILIGELQHSSTPHGEDGGEYQFQTKATTPVSIAVQLWSRTGEHRGGLLGTAIQEDVALPESIQEALQADTLSAAHWVELFGFFQEQEALYDLGGPLLAQMEQSNTPGTQFLWECTSAALELPGFDAETLRSLLPKDEELPQAITEPLQFLLARREGAQRQALADFALSLPQEWSMEELTEDFLAQKASEVLQLERKKGCEDFLKRYKKLATKSLSEGGEPSWRMAAAWASHLLHRSKDGYKWLNDYKPEKPLEQWRFAQIALKAEKTLEGLEMLKSAPRLPTSVQKREKLQKSFFQQLAKRVRGDLAENGSEWLRELITSGLGAGSPKVERNALRQLFENGDATYEELGQLAAWAEQQGDFENAEVYRKKLYEQNPEDGSNLQGLARLAVRSRDIQEALSMALKATHLDPRRFPLEPFIEEFHEFFFIDLKKLRTILIELTAHPALSQLEQELTNRERIQKELNPILEQTQKILKEGKLQEAREKAQEIIKKEPKLAPLAFRQIVEEVNQNEREMRQALQKLPRKDFKKRNQVLKDLVDRAQDVGFSGVAYKAIKLLVRFNPQYGLGYIRLARLSRHPEEQEEAFKKAAELARSPEQREKNIQEYGNLLKSQDRLEDIFPFILEQLAKHPKEERILEGMLLSVVNKLGAQESFNKQITEFLEDNKDNFSLKRVQKAFTKMEKLDPWKQKLLSLKISKSSRP